MLRLMYGGVGMHMPALLHISVPSVLQHDSVPQATVPVPPAANFA